MKVEDKDSLGLTLQCICIHSILFIVINKVKCHMPIHSLQPHLGLPEGHLPPGR
jgi:hypothetical protein